MLWSPLASQRRKLTPNIHVNYVVRVYLWNHKVRKDKNSFSLAIVT